MAISKDIRKLAIAHYKKGKTTTESEDIFLVNIGTIRRWIREFKEGKVAPSSPPGRPPSAACTSNVREVRRLLNVHSQRALGAHLPRPASRSTVRRIVKKLNLKVKR